MRKHNTTHFRPLLLTVLCASLVIAPSAQAEARIVSSQSLYQQLKPGMGKAEIKAICTKILERETSSKVAMLDAAQVYLHGKLMGVACGKADYYRAYALARDAGDDFIVRATLNFIRERANGGNKKALAALAKIEKERQ